MGKIKHLNNILELFEKSPVVYFSSINKKIKNKAYAKLLIHNLVVKGKIHKLSKGVYTIHTNPELAIFAFKPAYFGLQDALSFHNIWEQETISVIITSRKVRPGIRNILGSNVLIKHLDSKLLFGYEYFLANKTAYPYSDIEKTLIDLIYFNEPISSEVLKKLRKLINKNKLLDYLKKYNNKIKAKVLKLIPI